MKILLQNSPDKSYRYLHNAEHPQHDEIMSESPAATAEKLAAAVETNDDMTSMLAEALIQKVGNSLGEPQDFALNAMAAEMLRNRGEDVTPQSGMALAAELKAILTAHQAGTLVANSSDALPMDSGTPLDSNRSDLLPPTLISAPAAVATQATLTESAENIYPASDYLSVEAQNHISQALSTASFDRAGATAEFEANLGYTFEAVDATHHDALKTAVNQMVTDLIDVRFDQNNNGTDHSDWANFRDKYETQLSLFIDAPENITAYLTDNPVLPESVGTDVSAEQITAKYGPAGVEALVRAALPADEALAVLRLGYSQDIAPERMQEMAQLVGMMSASITKFEQQIQNFPQFNSPYNQISINELTDIKDRVLRGFNILESPADLSDVNQRIQSMSQIVEAYVDEDLSSLETAEQQAQHKRLSDFIDSYEAQLGNRNPEALSAAREALLIGEIDAAISATENLVSSGLNANVVDLVSSFQISSAQMPDGTLINADMIANDDTALFQATRYMNDFAAAGEVAQENIVNTDAIVGAHVLDYVSNNEARFNAQAETSVQGYLDQLASSDPVGYQVMLQQIDANGGRQNLVANFSKEMAAIEGFKDYVDNNHGASGNADMLELYANMEGYGALVFSDATVDVMGGILAQTLLTGGAFYKSIAQAGARGLTRVGAALPTRHALVAQSRAFLRSEASGLGRAVADDVTRVSDDALRGFSGATDDAINALSPSHRLAAGGDDAIRQMTTPELAALRGVADDVPFVLDDVGRVTTRTAEDLAENGIDLATIMKNPNATLLGEGLTASRTVADATALAARRAASSVDDFGITMPAVGMRNPVFRATPNRLATPANLIDDLPSVIPRRLPNLRTAAMVTPPALIGSALAADTILSDTPIVSGSEETPINQMRPSGLTLPDMQSEPVIDTSNPVAPEVEPELTLSEQIDAIDSADIRSKGTEIKAIMEKYGDYKLGDWQNISNEIATLYGIELTTEADRLAFGEQLQAQIKSVLGLDAQTAKLNDGKIGRSTMDTLDRALVSVTPGEVINAADELQNFEAQDGGWRANNRAMAQLFGIDFPADATDGQLKTFGRSIQAFAGGTDGAIGNKTIGRMQERLAALSDS